MLQTFPAGPALPCPLRLPLLLLVSKPSVALSGPCQEDNNPLSPFPKLLAARPGLSFRPPGQHWAGFCVCKALASGSDVALEAANLLLQLLHIHGPSLPFQGDQAVDAHAARAQLPPYSGGRVWSIVPCVSRGDDRALLGLLGG